MIEFNNTYDIKSPRQILLDIFEPDDEGWSKYALSLVKNNAGEKLVEFSYAFSESCLERLKKGLIELADGKSERFRFEPIEPAFCLKITRLRSGLFEFLCMVDINFVEGGAATETGIGMLIAVKVDDIKAAIAELS
jgi:hypothetical protein